MRHCSESTPSRVRKLIPRSVALSDRVDQTQYWLWVGVRTHCAPDGPRLTTAIVVYLNRLAASPFRFQGTVYKGWSQLLDRRIRRSQAASTRENHIQVSEKDMTRSITVLTIWGVRSAWFSCVPFTWFHCLNALKAMRRGEGDSNKMNPRTIGIRSRILFPSVRLPRNLRRGYSPEPASRSSSRVHEAERIPGR